jgi:hypothetical protein
MDSHKDTITYLPFVNTSLSHMFLNVVKLILSFLVVWRRRG